MLKLTRNTTGTTPPDIAPVVTAGFPTPTIKEDWERLAIEPLGPWTTELHPALHWIPQPARVQYPQKPRLNTVYWPTHVGGFAFCWTLLAESQLEILDAEDPGPPSPGVATTDVWVDWYDDNPGNTLPVWPTTGPAGHLPKARMWLLRAKAVWIPGDNEDKLWAVPLVDYRYFLNQASYPEVMASDLGDGTALIDYMNATIGSIALDFAFVPGQDYPVGQIPKIEPESLLELDGPIGQVTDGLLAMIGRRACFIPEGYAIGYPDGPSVAMQPQASIDNFDARVDGWLERKRLGGRPRFWSARDLPFGFRVNYPTDLAPGGRSFFTLDTSVLIDLTEGGVVSPGGISPGPRLDFHLSWLTVHDSGDFTNLYANANNMTARSLKWLIRPIDVVVAGMEPAVQTAHVGMWEWRTADSETAIHGLDPASCWFGSFWRKPSGNSDDGSDCVACGWLRDRDALIEGDRIFKVQVFGNKTPGGRCACIPDQGPDWRDEFPWIAKYDPDAEVWILRANVETCCGCATIAFDIANAPTVFLIDEQVTVPIVAAYGTMSVSNSCQYGEGPYLYDLVYECCTEDTITFTGVGPKNCSETMPFDGWPCDNSFKVIVHCSPCDIPNINCGVCDGEAPPYWQVAPENPEQFSGAFVEYNGFWYLQPVVGSNCTWRATCHGITVTLVLDVVGGNGRATVTYSGATGGDLVYRFTDIGTLHCQRQSILPRQSPPYTGSVNNITLDGIRCVPTECCPGVVIPPLTADITMGSNYPTCMQSLSLPMEGTGTVRTLNYVCTVGPCHFGLTLNLKCLQEGDADCQACGEAHNFPAWCVSGAITLAKPSIDGDCDSYLPCLPVGVGVPFCQMISGTEMTCDPFLIQATDITVSGIGCGPITVIIRPT